MTSDWMTAERSIMDEIVGDFTVRSGLCLAMFCMAWEYRGQ